MDLLSNFSKDRYDEFRQLVMTLILATDMARHVEYVLKLKQLASRAEEVDAICYILAAVSICTFVPVKHMLAQILTAANARWTQYATWKSC